MVWLVKSRGVLKEKRVKKLLVRTVLFFILTIACWVAACLLGDENNHYNTVLAILSLIPGVCYLVCAYQLNTALRVDK
jgi:hypothetical protein